MVPLIVKSPTRTHDDPLDLTDVESNRISAWFLIWKKSADLTWPSRSASPVEMDAVSIVISTLEAVTSYATLIVPVTVPNPPRIFVTIRWRATNSADV